MQLFLWRHKSCVSTFVHMQVKHVKAWACNIKWYMLLLQIMLYNLGPLLCNDQPLQWVVGWLVIMIRFKFNVCHTLNFSAFPPCFMIFFFTPQSRNVVRKNFTLTNCWANNADILHKLCGPCSVFFSSFKCMLRFEAAGNGDTTPPLQPNLERTNLFPGAL